MSNEKQQEPLKPYTPEEPVDEKTLQHEREEIREAARHAAQEQAAEELGDKTPASPEERAQAEKELHEAARKAQQENKKK